MLSSLSNLLSELKRRNTKVYIYGAGGNAGYVFRCLREEQIAVTGFIVSSAEGNPDMYFELPVVAVEHFREEDDYLILVSYSRNDKNFRDILQLLISYRVKNAVYIPGPIYQAMKDYYVTCSFNKGNLRIATDHAAEDHHNIFGYYDGGQEYYWRFSYNVLGPRKIGDAHEYFAEKTPIEEHEELYGKYIELSRLKGGNSEKNEIAVYMAQSHADRVELKSKHDSETWIVPIQVGAALTDKDICVIKDSTGDNISAKNGNYSECTALYWMWKNAMTSDYIGLCHYRRHMDLDENKIAALFANDIDVCVTRPTFVPIGINKFFNGLIPPSDMDVFMESIKVKAPEYYDVAKQFVESRFYPPCNLFVMKKKIFDEYMSYVFSIVFEVERFYNDLGIIRKDRYMGYLFELLLGIFISKNKDDLKVAYTDMLFYE